MLFSTSHSADVQLAAYEDIKSLVSSEPQHSLEDIINHVQNKYKKFSVELVYAMVEAAIEEVEG